MPDIKAIQQKYKFTDRVTGPPGARMIEQAGLVDNTQEPLVILDNASGAGIVTSLLQDMLDRKATQNAQIMCGDIKPEMVELAQKRIDASRWTSGEAKVVDIMNTGLPDGMFTHVLTNFGINLVPDSSAALKECYRILKPGGICAFTSWMTIGWREELAAALATIPGAPPFPTSEEFMLKMSPGPWWLESYVQEQLATHGFQSIAVETFPCPFTLKSPAAYVEEYGGMMTGITGQGWGPEKMKEYGGDVKGVLLKYLTEKYGEGKPFTVNMEAIVANSRKPSV